MTKTTSNEFKRERMIERVRECFPTINDWFINGYGEYVHIINDDLLISIDAQDYYDMDIFYRKRGGHPYMKNYYDLSDMIRDMSIIIPFLMLSDCSYSGNLSDRIRNLVEDHND